MTPAEIDQLEAYWSGEFRRRLAEVIADAIAEKKAIGWDDDRVSRWMAKEAPEIIKQFQDRQREIRGLIVAARYAPNMENKADV